MDTGNATTTIKEAIRTARKRWGNITASLHRASPFSLRYTDDAIAKTARREQQNVIHNIARAVIFMT